MFELFHDTIMFTIIHRVSRYISTGNFNGLLRLHGRTGERALAMKTMLFIKFADTRVTSKASVAGIMTEAKTLFP
jgi:hypothetical protein